MNNKVREMTNRLGVMAVLNGLQNACSSSSSEDPLFVRPECGVPFVGKVDSRIKRYHLMREMEKKNLATAGGTFFEQRVAQAYYDIVNAIFELEVWSKYPELVGRSITVDNGEPEKFESKTDDLFKPVGLAKIVTGSVDVRRDNFRYPDPAPRR